MKLGISFTPRHETPDEWAAALEALGCRAAVCPIAAGADGAARAPAGSRRAKPGKACFSGGDGR